MDSILDSAVLVLNLNYEPLSVATVKRAITMIVVGKAEIVENGRGVIRTPSTEYPCHPQTRKCTQQPVITASWGAVIKYIPGR